MSGGSLEIKYIDVTQHDSVLLKISPEWMGRSTEEEIERISSVLRDSFSRGKGTISIHSMDILEILVIRKSNCDCNK